jgi:hypothetical protein
MRIDYKHNLTKQQSYEKINKLLPELQAQYEDKISNPKWSWNNDNSKMDFSMEIMGFDVSGNIDVMDKKLVMEGDLPLIALPFSEKIEDMITAKLKEILA